MKTQNEKSENKDHAGKPGFGAAYSGRICAGLWKIDEASAYGADIEFALLKLDRNDEATHLFGATDIFDILEIARTLAHHMCSRPSLDASLRDDLRQAAIELGEITKRFVFSEAVILTQRLESASPKLATSQVN